MSMGKRIGYGFLALVPAVGILALQFLIVFAFLFGVTAVLSIQDGGAQGLLIYYIQAYGVMMENYTAVLVIFHVLAALLFGMWYYLLCGKKAKKESVTAFWTGRNVAGIFCIAAGFYFLVMLYMAALSWLWPDALEAYNRMMEQNGLADLTVLSTLVTIVLAPIGEEAAFRGLTGYFLKKAGVLFWIANFIQALLFGMAHMNFVQGSYVFLLALVLGWVYRRFGTIAAPVLLHVIFNFFGTYVATAMQNLPEEAGIYAGFAVGAVASFAAACVLLKKREALT